MLVVPAVAIIKFERLVERWGVDEACERAALEYVRETPVTLWKYRDLANALRDKMRNPLDLGMRQMRYCPRED